MIKAIETNYRGFLFRSRIEARYAVLFDTLGVNWNYEKEGFDLGKSGWYLPDFWLPDYGFFVEIKGKFPEDKEFDVANALSDGKNVPVVILTGLPNKGGFLVYYNTRSSFFSEEAEKCPIDKPGNYLSNMLSSPRCEGENEWGIHLGCPICGNDYTHIISVSEKKSDNYEAWQGRGDAIRIPMWGECGHLWTARYGFHKGFTFFDVEDCFAPQDNPLLFLAKYNKEKLEEAYDAARSARFEHGEKP